MNQTSFRQCVDRHRPLVLPVVHDALSARLAEQAGFHAYSIGGAALTCSQLAMPDLGIQSLGEYCAGIRMVMEGSRLPVFVDGENGFGDAKLVTRTVRAFESMGIGGAAFEDLRRPAQLGLPSAVEALDEVSGKLEAALSARRSGDFFVVGRTDAFAIHGLDEALRRARRYVEIGVDGVFVTGITAVDDLRRVADALDTCLMTALVEIGPFAKLTPQEFAALGYSLIVYPATVMLRTATAIRDALADIRNGRVDLPEGTMSYPDLTAVLGIADWTDIDQRFGTRTEEDRR
jgi:2-methylisocitrate lyase-like PEP mutase family enzyme